MVLCLESQNGFLACAVTCTARWMGQQPAASGNSGIGFIEDSTAIRSYVGSGILLMPSAFVNGGYVFTPVLWIFSWLISSCSGFFRF